MYVCRRMCMHVCRNMYVCTRYIYRIIRKSCAIKTGCSLRAIWIQKICINIWPVINSYIATSMVMFQGATRLCTRLYGFSTHDTTSHLLAPLINTIALQLYSDISRPVHAERLTAITATQPITDVLVAVCGITNDFSRFLT